VLEGDGTEIASACEGSRESHELSPHSLAGLRRDGVRQRSEVLLMLRAGQRIAAKYELERELGRGGMGAVWLARHVELGARRVAVKFLLNDRSLDSLERFRREALLASQIQTRHVVTVLDFGEHEGAPYLVMEHLAGQDLRALLQQRFRLDSELAVAILDQTAHGLQKAHEAGLVHRDIKPENIFLTQDEDGGLLVKILDFGIAKSVRADSATATGVMIGTVYYMSPEQFQGLKEVDHRTDLWALACVGYEMLVGARVFGGESFLMIGMQILGQERPVPSRMVAGLPSEVDAWLARALHPSLDKRFGSARELSAGFASAMGLSRISETVSDWPPGALPIDPYSSTVAGTSLGNTGLEASPLKRRRRPVVAVTMGLASVALAGVVAWGVSRSTAVSGNPAEASLSNLPAASSTGALGASSADAAARTSEQLLDRALALVQEGDVSGAHDLLTKVARESPLRSDERFTQVENAWADRHLSEAENSQEPEKTAGLLAEVMDSGADESRKRRAQTLASKHPSAGKPDKQQRKPPSNAQNPVPVEPPRATPTDLLPARY
jgi:serine/threonine-protein kinase